MFRRVRNRKWTPTLAEWTLWLLGVLLVSAIFVLMPSAFGASDASPLLAAGSTGRGPTHLPEELAEMTPRGRGPTSVVLGALLVSLVFYWARDIYGGLKQVLMWSISKFPFHLFKSRFRARWKAVGQWVDPSHHASLVAFRSIRKRWPLTVDNEGFKLLVEQMDPDKGTAAGKVECSAVRRPVGDFTIKPSADSPNRIALCVNLADRKLNLTLQKAG